MTSNSVRITIGSALKVRSISMRGEARFERVFICAILSSMQVMRMMSCER